MPSILIPIPSRGFDPSETGIPWRTLTQAGHEITFATPDATPGQADPRMVTGQDLSVLAPILRADANGRAAYTEMAASAEFTAPIAYADINPDAYEALILPGGHAKPMRPYLESPQLQRVTAAFFAAGKPVGAICHGVVLAARSRRPDNRSVLHGRKTTALLHSQEMLAYTLTRLWLADYYRTYPQTVQEEVTAALASPADFIRGPASVTRDSPANPNGFAVVDGTYVSARWPGDAHRFSAEMLRLLAA
jgi:protease I